MKRNSSLSLMALALTFALATTLSSCTETEVKPKNESAVDSNLTTYADGGGGSDFGGGRGH